MAIVKNSFLLATKRFDSTAFERGLVYVCDNDGETVLGMFVNKASSITLGKVFSHLGLDLGRADLREKPVLQGGQHLTDRLFALHDSGSAGSSRRYASSIEMAPNLLFTDFDELKADLAGGVGPHQIEVFVGAQLWRAVDLESTIQQGFWRQLSGAGEHILGVAADKRYEKARQLH